MGLHIRTQIRDAVAAALAGLPTTGDRVFKSRIGPLPQAKLPALRIYTPEDEAERLSKGAVMAQRREIKVVVEAVVTAKGEVEAAFDVIGVEVEAALADTDLGGLVKDFMFVRATGGLDGEGDEEAGLLSMEFAALAKVAEGAADTVLP